MAKLTVPNYFRYGEPEPEDASNAVHCQAIFSRIAEQNWEIRAHRHQQLWQLFLVDRGELEALLEFEEVTLIGPAMLVVPPAKVHGFSYAKQTEGTMISVADTFLRGALGDTNQRSLTYRTEAIQVLDLRESGECLMALRSLVDPISSESARRRPGFAAALAAYLKLLFIEIDRIDSPRDDFGAATEVGATFERFRTLVLRHLRSHMSVADYCGQLGIGERRLNRICKAVVGESPLSYIHRQLLDEAKRCLVHTAMPVTSIAYDLGFEDSAYFSRFFKKHTGVAPSVFAAQYGA